MTNSGDLRLERILAAAYAALDAGARPDVDALCGGDAALVSRVRAALGEDSGIDRALSALRQELRPTLGPGSVIGGYVLGEQLGEGGMGRVYHAEHESGSRAAIKLQRLGDSLSRLRFRREAEITAALAHPNIVRILDFGSERDVAWIAMEPLRGPTFATWACDRSPREIAAAGAALADALHSAHAAGVVHRDVKPANILVDAGVPHLLDFGLARAEEQTAVTREGAALGTLPYMAPELLRQDGATADARSDVYGLGATLYEALVGVPPFRAASTERLIHLILEQDPRPLRLPRGARGLEHVVLRALAKDPAHRFPSAEGLAQDLRRFADEQPVQTKRPSTAARLVRRARRYPRVAAASAVLLVGLLAIAGWWARDYVRDRAVFIASLADIRRSIDGAELASSEGRLAAWEVRYPAAPAVHETRRRLEARRELERLLNTVHLPQEARSPERHRQLFAQLDGSDAVEFWPDEVAMARLYLALLVQDREIAEREYARARTVLERGLPCAARLARALLAGEVPVPDGPVPATAEDRLASVTLLRLAGVPAPARGRLVPLDEVTRTSYRLHFELANIESEAGRQKEALALWWAAGLLRPDRTTPVRNRARQQMLAGDLEAADRTMAMLLDADHVPRNRIDAVVWCEIAEVSGDLDEAGRRLAVARAPGRWPDDAALALRAGQNAWTCAANATAPNVAAERRDAARELFRHVLRCDHTPWMGGYAALMGWYIDLETGDWPPGRSAEVLAEIERRVSTLRNPQLLGDLHMFARDLCMEDPAQALSHTLRAVQVDPGWCEANRLLAGLVAERADALPADALPRSRACLDTWRRSPPSRPRAESDLERYEVYVAGVQLAQLADDAEASVSWASDGVAFAEERELESPPYLEELRQIIEPGLR
ncbi:MAG: serine/threonine-protein kinase [Planctomycetota bacterium]